MAEGIYKFAQSQHVPSLLGGEFLFSTTKWFRHCEICWGLGLGDSMENMTSVDGADKIYDLVSDEVRELNEAGFRIGGSGKVQFGKNYIVGRECLVLSLAQGKFSELVYEFRGHCVPPEQRYDSAVEILDVEALAQAFYANGLMRSLFGDPLGRVEDHCTTPLVRRVRYERTDREMALGDMVPPDPARKRPLPVFGKQSEVRIILQLRDPNAFLRHRVVVSSEIPPNLVREVDRGVSCGVTRSASKLLPALADELVDGLIDWWRSRPDSTHAILLEWGEQNSHEARERSRPTRDQRLMQAEATEQSWEVECAAQSGRGVLAACLAIEALDAGLSLPKDRALPALRRNPNADRARLEMLADSAPARLRRDDVRILARLREAFHAAMFADAKCH